ncbi:MAG: hypothetical protein HZB85_09985 [Deltaproteobacteria bacterium]|nr:hypothetical protein [Deltaproteobacteria bacterium]
MADFLDATKRPGRSPASSFSGLAALFLMAAGHVIRPIGSQARQAA